MKYEEELIAAMHASRGASEIALQFYQSDVDVQYKEDASPVTEADLQIDAYIISVLGQAFPEDAILTEESVDDLSRLDKDRVWIIDPIDGTKNFVEGTGDFGISIGLVEKGQPVVGVVCAPAWDATYFAVKGQGAWKKTASGDERITVSTIADVSSMRATGSTNYALPAEQEVREGLGLTKFKGVGGCLKGCVIAEGKLDFYLRLNYMSEWDMCATQLIIEEAGGSMTLLNGKKRTYNQHNIQFKDFLVTNGVIHTELLERIKTLRKAKE